MLLSSTKKPILPKENDIHDVSDNINEDIKIIEAKTAIILLNDHIFSRNQYTQWRLSILFDTFYKNEKNESMKMLYISSDTKHPWLSSEGS
ncbi:unnamed protein product [Cunninghamella blakesleeana]